MRRGSGSNGALAAVALVAAIGLTGCFAAPGPSGLGAPSSEESRAPTPAASLPAISPAPTPTPPTRSYDAEREAAYQAGIAAWTHPIPAGYAWPDAWTDLPYLGTGGQQAVYLTPSGIYHCMMVGAAWDAYFTLDDPVESRRLAALADEFAPDAEWVRPVTGDDGAVIADSLAAESGICRGFVGDLTD